MPPSNLSLESTNTNQSLLFNSICNDLSAQSYSVQLNALPHELIKLLCDRIKGDDGPHYTPAGVGREKSHQKNTTIRRDEIAWIDNKNPTEHKWNLWTEALRIALNRQLFLGLTSVDCHYARYQKGGFYKKHLDAFTGPDNRKISIVLFLNEIWETADEGELLLFVGPDHDERVLVTPQLGTMAIFISTEIPHEVLPTNTTRNSIAGWYR